MAESCYVLTDRFRVNAPLPDVWKFFSTAENLPLITPPWLRFTILTPSPIVLRKDMILDYSASPLGFAMRWKTRILEWEPMTHFVDMQERGPYALWHHEHTFQPDGDGTICADKVNYRLPLGPIGRLLHAIKVRRQLMSIFSYRRQVIAAHLGGIRQIQPEVSIIFNSSCRKVGTSAAS